MSQQGSSSSSPPKDDERNAANNNRNRSSKTPLLKTVKSALSSFVSACTLGQPHQQQQQQHEQQSSPFKEVPPTKTLDSTTRKVPQTTDAVSLTARSSSSRSLRTSSPSVANLSARLPTKSIKLEATRNKSHPASPTNSDIIDYNQALAAIQTTKRQSTRGENLNLRRSPAIQHGRAQRQQQAQLQPQQQSPLAPSVADVSAQLRSTLALGQLITSKTPSAGSKLIAHELKQLNSAIHSESSLLRKEIAQLPNSLASAMKNVLEGERDSGPFLSISAASGARNATGGSDRRPVFGRLHRRFPVYRRPARMTFASARKSISDSSQHPQMAYKSSLSATDSTPTTSHPSSPRAQPTLPTSSSPTSTRNSMAPANATKTAVTPAVTTATTGTQTINQPTSGALTTQAPSQTTKHPTSLQSQALKSIAEAPGLTPQQRLALTSLIARKDVPVTLNLDTNASSYDGGAESDSDDSNPPSP